MNFLTIVQFLQATPTISIETSIWKSNEAGSSFLHIINELINETYDSKKKLGAMSAAKFHRAQQRKTKQHTNAQRNLKESNNKRHTLMERVYDDELETKSCWSCCLNNFSVSNKSRLVSNKKRLIRKRTKTNNNDAPPPPPPPLQCAIRATPTRALYSTIGMHTNRASKERVIVLSALCVCATKTTKPHKKTSRTIARRTKRATFVSSRHTALATRQEQENKSHRTNVASRCRPTERHETTTDRWTTTNKQTQEQINDDCTTTQRLEK